MRKPTNRGSSSSRTEDNNSYKRQRGDHEQHTTKSKRSLKDEQVKGVPRNEETSPIFPRITPLLVFGVILALRVVYVLDPKNWWMVHPDEVFQSMEVAHIEVYGYGFRAYDFSKPETPSDNVTGFRQMELNAGMYALRSPLFPYLYVFVSWLADAVSVHVNPYLLWRLSHVTVASLLPLAVYNYVSRLYILKDKGHVATILVASSTHLNVFSTHSLLHSFLSPLTFLAMSLLIDSPSEKHSSPTLSNAPSSHIYRNSDVPTTGILNQDNDQDNHNNNTSNVSNKKAKTTIKTAEIIKGCSKSNGLNVSHTEQEADNKVDTVLYQKNLSFCNKKRKYVQITLALFIATITCYIRPDVLLIYVVNIVIFPEMKQFLCPKNIVAVLLGVFGALGVGIGTDFSYYGWGVSSCINWVHFNVILGRSTSIFGYMNSWFYFETFFWHDIGITSLSICSTFTTIVLFWKHKIHERLTDNKDIKNSLKKNLDIKNVSKTNIFNGNYLCHKSLLAWSIPLVAYSLNGHKETRFINDIIILVFIFIADFLVNLKQFIQSKTLSNNVIRIILIIFVITQYILFPSNINNQAWVYQKTESVQDINLCIKYISEQNDVTGVFYDSNLHMTGGTSLLHHDVPILSLVGSGFYEFGPETRHNYSRGNLLTSRRTATVKHNPVETSTASINEFTRASNYISVANAQAVVRVIIQKPAYNYLVLRRDRKFLDFGFVEVFVTSHSRVLRRLLDERSEYKLQGLLDKISMGTNSTVLLHEGDVLFNMNQFQEASARFYKAITLDEKLLDAYLPLQICYRHLGEMRAARAVRGKCVSLFGEDACLEVNPSVDSTSTKWPTRKLTPV